ncbi:MAG: hypothetical protein H3C34_09710 [Caldilineaceae bacterium]|nr:hypothetical protein [Caldilineaceae bacterium]
MVGVTGSLSAQRGADKQLLTEDAFQTASLDEIAKVAPPAIVYAAAGTRRSAALAGLASHSEAYVRWSREQMISACKIIFDHGVHHIFTVLAAPGQFQEVGRYRQRLLDWISWGVAGPEALRDYRELGWRVRLLGGDDLPTLARVQEQLSAATPAIAERTLWFMVIPDPEAPWRWILDAVWRSQARSRAEVVQALYGEELPLITLYFSFGKPIVAPYLLPPLLAGTVQCYWTQRPGYRLTEAEWRAILYDYAYLRATWRADKTGRAETSIGQRDAWERGPTLGLGMRLGPFWYPRPWSGDSLVGHDGSHTSG